jgi:cobalt-zinc-cadmium efflux system membrane fusion protein
MRSKQRWLLTAGLLIGIAIGGWLTIRSLRTPEPTASSARAPIKVAADTVAFEPQAPQLAMIRAQPAPALEMPVADALAARVTYDDDATARLFAPVAARIVALEARPGDQVRKGQVLARVDAPDFGTARADLAKARADEERKRLAFERARELGPGEGIAIKDLEAARADYEAASAETARAAQRVRNLNPLSLPVDGQRVAITSPLSGVVAERNASPALEVAPGSQSPLFVVTDLRRLWLLIDVPERLLPLIKAGARVSIESDAYSGEPVDARIVQVGPTVDPNTRRVVARARIDNIEGKLLPEMFVRALVLQDAGRAVRVPNSAIVTAGIYSYVYVESAPGRFERRKVELALRGADSSYVSRGLQANEKVVVAGALLLDAEIVAAHKP